MTRKEQLILVFVAGATIVGASVVATRGAGAPAPVEPGPAETPIVPVVTPAPFNSDSTPRAAADAIVANPVVEPDTMVVVSLRGAVNRPAVYTLEEGKRVFDLLEAAGGAHERANVDAINLAAPLVDGTTLNVPWIDREAPPNPSYYLVGSAPAAAAATPQATGAPLGVAPASVGQTINVNTATKDQLMALPGIGPVYAERIVAYRAAQPFRTVDELTNIAGIGEKRLAAIRDRVTVR